MANTTRLSLWLILFSFSCFAEPIFDAIKEKNMSKLMSELSNFDVDYQDQKGRSALMLCARVGFIDGANYLLGKHADLNIKDLKGRTALIYAVANNNTKMAQKLMNYGASPTIADHKGKTPLAYISKFAVNSKLENSIKRNILIEDLLQKYKEESLADQNNKIKIKPSKTMLGSHACVSCGKKSDGVLVQLCHDCKINFIIYIIKEAHNNIIYFPQFKAIPISVPALEELNISQSLIEKFRLEQVKVNLKKYQNYVKCPGKNCENFLNLKKGAKNLCVYCHYEGCACGIIHDSDITCEDGKLIFKAGFRNCPGCSVLCQKVKGCDLITCPNCHEHWRFHSAKKETRRNVGVHTFPDYAFPETWQNYALMR